MKVDIHEASNSTPEHPIWLATHSSNSAILGTGRTKRHALESATVSLAAAFVNEGWTQTGRRIRHAILNDD